MKKTRTVPVSSRCMLGACLMLCACLTVRADCGGNCAICSWQLDINSIECVSECEERMNSGNSWSLCKLLLRDDDRTPGSAGNEHSQAQQHHMDRRYGGFMKKTAEFYGMEPDKDEGMEKRYGGFMKRGGGGKELLKRYGGFMRRVGEPQWRKRSREEDEEGNIRGIEKRYGGFMGF